MTASASDNPSKQGLRKIQQTSKLLMFRLLHTYVGLVGSNMVLMQMAMAVGKQSSPCGMSIVHSSGPIFEKSKKPSPKGNNIFDSLKANTTLLSVSLFSTTHSCRYPLSMPYHTCSGLCPSQKHSCSRLLIFTERPL